MAVGVENCETPVRTEVGARIDSRDTRIYSSFSRCFISSLTHTLVAIDTVPPLDHLQARL